MARLDLCWFLMMGLVLGAAGCGQNTASGPTSDAAEKHSAAGNTPSMDRGAERSAEMAGQPGGDVGHAAPQAHQPDPLDPNASPDLVVGTFLEATRRGDDQLARQLLSAKALEATSKAGLAVKPPGTPQMTYQITQVEYPQDIAHGAYVHSVWTEQTNEAEESFDITWVLRKEPVGWRIIGMAAQFDDQETPYFLNFEQPEELYRRMQAAGESVGSTGETASEASPGGAQGGRPDSTARMPEAPPIR
ncbi:MAG: hypothetical protein KatS3mg110_1220 [Pirellulaceae bacterium]|nr:MAG: hypothetical protein KatS3mg110_1220 [Pirellulaceae bacterium]